jgi:hypothetical protein
MDSLNALFLLTLLACASANPVEKRQATTATALHLPTSFAALGDSYSAGIGSGKFLTSSADGSDNACARMDGSYPWQLFNLQPFEEKLPSFPDFFACSGDVMDNIDGQVAKLGGKKVDVITLSISGNDFGFSNIVVRTWLSLLSGLVGHRLHATYEPDGNTVYKTSFLLFHNIIRNR